MILSFLLGQALTQNIERKEVIFVVKTQNIDTERLKAAIEKSGLRVGHISEQIGISRQSLYNKIAGKVAFRQSEVYVLCDLLKLTGEDGEKIFFPERLGDT